MSTVLEGKVGHTPPPPFQQSTVESWASCPVHLGHIKAMAKGRMWVLSCPPAPAPRWVMLPPRILVLSGLKG